MTAKASSHTNFVLTCRLSKKNVTCKKETYSMYFFFGRQNYASLKSHGPERKSDLSNETRLIKKSEEKLSENKALFEKLFISENF